MTEGAFDILSRDTEIHKSRLLEASAGTGKTFSIENLVVRFLVEGDIERGRGPCTIDEILAVTFTKKAAAELKERIRGAIVKAIDSLEDGGGYDYIVKYADGGATEIHRAKRRLKEALFSYDEAQIFTIHGFCLKALKEYAFESRQNLGDTGMDTRITTQEMIEIVKDFFRTSVGKEKYSVKQLYIVMKKYNGIDALAIKLAGIITKQGEFPEYPDITATTKDCKEKIAALQGEYHYNSEEVLEIFGREAKKYCLLCNNKNIAKEDVMKNATAFAAMFDDAEDVDFSKASFSFLKSFSPENIKKRFVGDEEGAAFFAKAYELLKDTIYHVENPAVIFARMARDCRIMASEAFEEREKNTIDGILDAMALSVDDKDFIEAIQGRYRVAIIDEFQDTDPLQWKIFSTLFAQQDHHGRYLYLVGDPKQSIYSFRNADIYTYLNAADTMGENGTATLHKNFRSHSDLVRALNVLFSKDNTPKMITLPQEDREMPYREVLHCDDIVKPQLSGKRGSVHFFVGEESINKKTKRLPTPDLEKTVFFPFIVEEIERLHSDDGMPYSSFAVLVKDRYQGQNIEAALRKAGAPTKRRGSRSLADTKARTALKDVVSAVIAPRDLSAVKIALSSELIAWDDEAVRELLEDGSYEKIIATLYSLRKILYDSGFAAFFNAMMAKTWGNDTKSVAEKIVSREGGDDLYNELLQLADVVIQHQNTTYCSPEGIVRHLEGMKDIENFDEDKLKIRQNSDDDAVEILTIHSSKGLEFDVVFALGLASRTKKEEDIIAKNEGGIRKFLAAEKDSDEWRRYYEEIDAEKMRQLYVSMTRAKYMTYAPVVIDSEKSTAPYGTASPMELFLARLGQEEAAYEELYSRMQNFKKESLIDFISQHDILGYSILEKKEDTISRYHDDEATVIYPPESITIPESPSYFRSFTSLASPKNEHRIETPPHDYICEDKTIHTLPAGKVTGTILHDIMEACLTTDDDVIDIVKKYITATSLEEWGDVIVDIINNSMTTQLIAGEKGFRLCDVARDMIACENEFLFPETDAVYLNGAIDIFFEHKGKYYILDWKSTWLGTDGEAYHHGNLEKSMEIHDYRLQGAIYTQAIQRYLSIVETRKFEECFGGVLYCFFRGLDKTKSQQGVYHFFPEENTVRSRI
ncbi:MAG: UvrD-helicase domain-containing protein [Waddliaceae bacterium]|jgi:exodeoxyribonuclease V beta subunit|nr:UvrD-helicase domain-containing protein [Waddliaceae bacterium]